jgi:hypothetical protein
MNRSILVGLAILIVSTSAASAWTHRTHHTRAVHPNASAAAINPNPYAHPMNANAYAGVGAPPAFMAGPVNSSDYTQYMKNLHDSV